MPFPAPSPMSRRRRRGVAQLAVGVVAVLLAAPFGVAQAGTVASSGQLSGLIEDQAGLAVAGATVQVAVPGTGATAATATTGTDGQYTVSLPAGHYDVVVEAGPASARVTAPVKDVTVDTDSHLNVVIAGRVIDPVTLTGRVRTTAGAPLPVATVSVADRQTITDNNGQFVLDRVGADTPLSVSPATPVGQTITASVDDAHIADRQPLDIRLPLVTLGVTVTNQDGSPLTGATVNVASDENCGACPGAFTLVQGATTRRVSQRNATTDSSGHAAVTLLASSNAHVWVTTGPRADVVAERTGVTITADRNVNLTAVPPPPTPAPPAPTPASDPTASPAPTTPPGWATVPLTNEFVTYSGVIHDFDGTPINTGTLNLDWHDGHNWSETVDVAADGSFSIPVPPGTYDLTIQHGLEDNPDDPMARPEQDELNYTVVAVDVHADRHDDIVLPGASFPVTVRDSSGALVAGAWVTAWSGVWPGQPVESALPGAATWGYSETDRRTGPDGSVAVRILPGVPPTTVTVEPPAGRGVRTVVNVPAGATSLGVQLGPALTLHGRLSDPNGQAAWVAEGELRPDPDPPGTASYPITFNSDGTYAVSALPGKYRIALDTFDRTATPSSDTSDWSLVSDPITLTADRTLDLTLNGGPADVRAFGPDGTELPDGFGNPTAVTAEGGFTLAPGLTATVTSESFSPGYQPSLSLTLLAPATLSTTWTDDYNSFSLDAPINLPAIHIAPGDHVVVSIVPDPALSLSSGPNGLAASPNTDGSATISWTAPDADGGSPILGYLVAPQNSPDHAVYVDAGITTATLSIPPTDPWDVFFVTPVTAHGVGQGAVVRVQGTAPTPTPTGVPSGQPETGTPPLARQTGAGHPAAPARAGYWALSADGHVYNFGDAPSLGNGSSTAVDLEPTPSGDGYWILNTNGTVTAVGDAKGLGNVDLSKLAKGEVPASLSATPSGNGYWVFTNRGRVLTYGDAPFLGDMSATKLNGPVLGSVATPTGKGYYMVASDGGIFAFGDATFDGSMGGKELNAPVQSLVPDGDGHGYWVVAADGGIFAFDAPFKGSMGATKLNKPVVGMVRYGDGYLMVGADGGIFNFSDSPFAGSLGDKPPASPVVAVAALP